MAKIINGEKWRLEKRENKRNRLACWRKSKMKAYRERNSAAKAARLKWRGAKMAAWHQRGGGIMAEEAMA